MESVEIERKEMEKEVGLKRNNKWEEKERKLIGILGERIEIRIGMKVKKKREEWKKVMKKSIEVENRKIEEDEEDLLKIEKKEKEGRRRYEEEIGKIEIGDEKVVMEIKKDFKIDLVKIGIDRNVKIREKGNLIKG